MKFLIFYAVIVFMFFGCQMSLHFEETMSQTNLYNNYEARYYEPALARFSMADPLAEKYPNISPYAYSVKNQIYVDLKGDSLAKVLLVSRDSLIWKSAINAAER